MEIHQIAEIVIAAINVLFLPLIVGAVKWLFRVEKRLLIIETKMKFTGENCPIRVDASLAD